MGNRGGILAAAGVLALLTACSTPAPAPVANTTTSAAPSTSKPAPTSDAPNLGNGPGSQPPTTPQPPPPHSPDKVTSACPFLGVTESSAVMGVVLDTYAVEEAPSKDRDATTHHCNYASRTGGRQLLDLYVTVIPGTGQLAGLVKDWTKPCLAPATPIAGVDGTTRTCKLNDNVAGNGRGYGDVLVLVAKKSHGQTRLAQLILRPFPADVYTKLAQLLSERL